MRYILDLFDRVIIKSNYNLIGGGGGHEVLWWLKHYATRRKVAGSSPD
jgi:hypothetical protein